MKVYVLTEYENIIRGVTLSKEIAINICNSFEHLDIKVNEFEIIDGVKNKEMNNQDYSDLKYDI